MVALDYRYPVAVIQDLPADRPTASVILGKDLVVWRDGSGAWRVFEDKCPHRKVPLSEGRLETDGTLQCAYHGWRFNGAGSCTAIPQALTEEREAKVCAVPRACATSYPTAEADGLLFVWMHAGPEALEESQRQPPKYFADYLKQDRLTTPWHVREMPIGWDVVVENVTDPAHVPFSHHGVQGNRNKPTKPNFTEIARMECDGGYRVTSPPQVSPFNGKLYTTTIDVAPPNHYTLQRHVVAEDDAENGKPGKSAVTINIHLVPVTPGRTRMFTRFEFDMLAGTRAGKLMRLRPTWHDHIERNSVLDGDSIFLARQSQLLRNGNSPRESYYLPSPADLPSIALMRWMAGFSPGGVAFYPDVRDNFDASSSTPPRDYVLDRRAQHVKFCKSCQGALRNVQLAIRVLPLLAGGAFLALAGFLGQGLPLLSAPPLTAIAVMALTVAAVHAVKRLERQLTFADYVHADKK